MVNIGKNVRRFRQALKLSQEKLAQKSNLSTFVVSRIEVGKNSPTYKTLCKLAKGLNVSVEELVRK